MSRSIQRLLEQLIRFIHNLVFLAQSCFSNHLLLCILESECKLELSLQVLRPLIDWMCVSQKSLKAIAGGFSVCWPDHVNSCHLCGHLLIHLAICLAIIGTREIINSWHMSLTHLICDRCHFCLVTMSYHVPYNKRSAQVSDVTIRNYLFMLFMWSPKWFWETVLLISRDIYCYLDVFQLHQISYNYF